MDWEIIDSLSVACIGKFNRLIAGTSRYAAQFHGGESVAGAILIQLIIARFDYADTAHFNA
jgi:hypothetical protein